MEDLPIAYWSRCREFLHTLPYGKVLPGAIYLHRDSDACRMGPLSEILAVLAQRHAVSDEFNVMKFRMDAPRLSFLHYPSFFEHAHPSLEEAVSIDLCSGRSLRTAYRDSLNPPILHRKELLLGPDHPRFGEFAALSTAEEQAGLYDNTPTIGFRINWERLLSSRGLAVDGHCLVREATPPGATSSEVSRAPAVAVFRHRTAITRYQLSGPVKILVEHGQLLPSSTFLDYGCGLGADIRGLCKLGFNAFG